MNKERKEKLIGMESGTNREKRENRGLRKRKGRKRGGLERRV